MNFPYENFIFEQELERMNELHTDLQNQTKNGWIHMTIAKHAQIYEQKRTLNRRLTDKDRST